ncbi:MAG TPA: ATP-binding protein [Chthoniobacterales bacterium]|jgi:two-component system CheB/CheR fusion protein|nr:ATP-binding protein [Chthoniobacterales bacterium]
MEFSLDNAPCGVLIFTDDGHVASVNVTLCRLLGYEREELVGAHLQAIFSPGARVFYQTHLFPMLKLQGEVEEVYMALRAKSGEEVPFLLNARRQERDGRNENDCVLVRMRQRMHFEGELLKAKRAAESANIAKDQFLAALSHELRTPLSPVLMMSTAMELDPAVPAEVREQAGIIRRNAELEARLIDDLLDLSRIRHGKLTLVRGPVDIHNLLAETEEIVRSEGTSKRVLITFEKNATHCCVNGDAARLQQVFWNIIKNAVKFTPSGGQVRVVTSNADGELIVRVIDTGMGIAPEALPKIFDAFQQGNLATGSFGGLGLGLAITRAIVQLHGGKIVAESEAVGRGATFSVALRTIPTPLSAPPPADPVLAVKRGNLRLLLVEDHDSTREVLSRILQRSGHQVHGAGTGAEAVELLKSAGPFDAVISDLGLPDRNGFELLAEIRAIQPELPAIALSGYGMDEDVKRAKQAGFIAHLVKPVPFDQLRALLDHIAARTDSTG